MTLQDMTIKEKKVLKSSQYDFFSSTEKELESIPLYKYRLTWVTENSITEITS